MTHSLLNSLLILLILFNLFALGTSRIRAVIQTVSIQGCLLGCLPLLVHVHINAAVVLIVIGTLALKAIVIPGMLSRVMRDMSVHREVEPFISLTKSLMLGAIGTGLAMAFAQHLPLVSYHAGSLLVPASLSTVLTGFIILTTRKKAVSQVLGYLILENGIFVFGLLLLEPLPFFVELGVLLDLFVCVFVMGFVIHNINREFSSVNTDQLSSLKE